MEQNFKQSLNMREDEPFRPDTLRELLQERAEEHKEEPEEKEKPTYLPDRKEGKWGQNKEAKKQKEKQNGFRHGNCW